MIRDGSKLGLPPSRSFSNLYHSNIVYESAGLDGMPKTVTVGYEQAVAPDLEEQEQQANAM
jgi:hypothetical protein